MGQHDRFYPRVVATETAVGNNTIDPEFFYEPGRLLLFAGNRAQPFGELQAHVQGHVSGGVADVVGGEFVDGEIGAFLLQKFSGAGVVGSKRLSGPIKRTFL